MGPLFAVTARPHSMQPTFPPIYSNVPAQFYGYKTRGRMLGSGATAKVFLGESVETGEPVAIKEIDYARFQYLGAKQKQLLESEIQIMKSLSQFKHENILTLYDEFSFDNNDGNHYQYLILEYCNGNDFDKYLKHNHGAPMNEDKARHFMIQFARGLRLLRFHNVSHRDLKPQNMLLHQGADQRTVLKIADFGFAKILETQDLAATHCGSPLYMAPEIHEHRAYSAKADLWSVGIILYQMVTGSTPFRVASLEELAWKLKSEDIKFSPRMEKQLSSECRNLVLSLLQKNPHRRISWEDFFCHPWFGEIIELPASIQLSPQFELAWYQCSAVAEIADEYAGIPSCRGEALSLYLKFLYDLRKLYLDSHGTVMSKDVFEQHFTLYLTKAQHLSRVTEPRGVPEKLIYSKMVGFAMVAGDAEATGRLEEAKNYYAASLRLLGKLRHDAVSTDDQKTLDHSIKLLEERIQAVTV